MTRRRYAPELVGTDVKPRVTDSRLVFGTDDVMHMARRHRAPACIWDCGASGGREHLFGDGDVVPPRWVLDVVRHAHNSGQRLKCVEGQNAPICDELNVGAQWRRFGKLVFDDCSARPRSPNDVRVWSGGHDVQQPFAIVANDRKTADDVHRAFDARHHWAKDIELKDAEEKSAIVL